MKSIQRTDIPMLPLILAAAILLSCFFPLYGSADNPAGDPAADSVSEPSLQESEKPLISSETEAPVVFADENTVTVTTADEFLSAIRPGATILLDAPLFDLSTVSSFCSYGHDYYRWVDCYDGAELVICNCDGLTIIGDPVNPENVEIITAARYANVLSFEGCSDLILDGFTAGHADGPTECAGGVLNFNNSGNIDIESCRLYGCGILGITADSCASIHVTDTEIYNCRYGGAEFSFTDGISFVNCSIYDVDGPMLSFWQSGDKAWNGIPIDGYGEFNIVDGQPADYVYVTSDPGTIPDSEYYYYDDGGLYTMVDLYPDGFREAADGEEFPLGFIEGKSWTDAKLVIDVKGPEECKEVMFRPGWLPFAPDNSINAWAEKDGWYSRISSEITPVENRPHSMQEMSQPFLIDIYYSAQFGEDGHPILLNQTPEIWSFGEDSINGLRAVSFYTYEQLPDDIYSFFNYVLLFNEEEGWMVRIAGEADLSVLTDIAWGLEFKELESTVSYNDFDSHNVIIDCAVG